MNKVKNWFVKNRHYFYPALITFVILLIAFIIKGVAPFGDNYSALIDYEDGLIPSYTHLWDFIHGKSNFLFNENLGMGSNIYASSVLNTFFSPLSYLVGLSSREGIRFFVGYIIVIKMMLMATTSYIVFKKWFKKVDYKTLIVYSLLWTFSSWLMVHISNVGWLDVMIIFPFLIDSLKHLIEKGKITYFVSMLTLCLIYSYYMSYMVLVMMIVMISCASFTLIDKENRKRVIGQVFIGTLFSLMLSMFAFLPSFIQTQASYRFTDEMTSISGNYMLTKIIMVLFYAALIYIPIRLFKYKNQDKVVKFFFLFLMLTVLPVIIEPINKMWHTGSYFCYPFRYSYIPIFFAIMASLYYFSEYHGSEVEPIKWKRTLRESLTYATIIIAALGYLMVLVMEFNYKSHLAYAIDYMSAFLYALPLVSMIALVFITYNCFKKEKRKLFIHIISMLQILITTIGFMGPHDMEVITSQYSLRDGFDLEKLDNNYALKDETRFLSANFPLIVDYKSMSTWLHINGMYANLYAQALGYETNSTVIMSYGGTVFSDMLSNVRYILSYEVLDDSLYTLVEHNKIDYGGILRDIYLYEYKYNLGLGLIVDESLELLDLDPSENVFDTQNDIYRKLFSKSEDIIEVDTYKKVLSKNITLNVSEAKALYLNVSDNLDDITIKVNGKELTYLVGNGIVNLGVYENEEVIIEIESLDSLEKVEVASIKVSDIKELSDEYSQNVVVSYEGNKINVRVNALKSGKLYLPINYENNSWSATNNEKDVNVERFLETYLVVEVNEGENEIVLTFTPQMMKEGIFISLFTLAIVAILFAINIKFKFFDRKAIVAITSIFGIVVGLAVGSFVYLIPLTK